MKRNFLLCSLFVIFIVSGVLISSCGRRSTNGSTGTEKTDSLEIDTVKADTVSGIAKVLYNKDDYDSLIIMLKKWEGFRSVKYKDADGFAIGYGHHIKDYEADFPDSISEAYAEKILWKDITKLIDYTYTKTGLTGKRLLALSALLFNTGNQKFESSTLLRYIETGNDSIGTEWKKWCHYRKDGEVFRSNHLLKRRDWEVAFYLKGCDEYSRERKAGIRNKDRRDRIQVREDSALFLFNRSGDWLSDNFFVLDHVWGRGLLVQCDGGFRNCDCGDVHIAIPLHETAL